MFHSSRFQPVLTRTTVAVSLMLLALATGASETARAALSTRPGENRTSSTSGVRSESDGNGERAAALPDGSARAAVHPGGSGDTVPNLSLVRTVSAPGGLSAQMRTALQSLEGLFSGSTESARSTVAPPGIRTLLLGGGFMNVYVARLDNQGKLSSACVSSVEEALSVVSASGPSHGKDTIPTHRALPTPEEE